MIGKTFSNFRITAKLGQGGMGEVYRAEDAKLGREVAIKVLPAAVSDDRDRLARFQREARVLASLNHQNIAAIYDVQEIEGQQLLILELVEGIGLDERIRRGPVPLAEALDLARQIAEALEFAHEKGVIHRDLKPANVKITPEGRVKVLDFGLAKAAEPETEAGPGAGMTHSPTLTANMTAAGVLLGTAAYMSPEQARGHVADKRADVWAFGCVLDEMPSGRQTFHEPTVSDTLAAVLKTDVPFDELPPDTPERIRWLVRRCLDKDPRQRLRDIGEARITIERELAAPEARTTERAGVGAEAATGDRQRAGRLPWILAGAMAVAAVGLGVLIATSSTTDRRVVRATVNLPPELRLELDGVHPGPPALSPDGNRVVFSVREGDGTVRLWLRDLDTLEPRPLAGTEGAGYPFWSPDGEQIGFFAGDKLKKIDADGGAVLSLCDAENGKGGSWSREGVIVFAPTSRSAIHTVPDAGGEPVAVTVLDEARSETSHRHPRLLPDGKHFVYLARVATSGEGAEKNQLKIGSIDGAESAELFDNLSQAEFARGHLLYVRESVLMARPFDADDQQFTGAAFPVAENVAFSSGASLAVFSVAGDVLSYLPGEIEATGSQLEWKDRSGTVVRQIGEPAQLRELNLSPDERLAVVSIPDPEGSQDLWIWDLEREIRTRFTFSEGGEWALAWSPDSDRVAYASSRSGVQDLYAKSVTGSGDEALLLQSPLDEYPSDWSPDGKYVIFSGRDLETRDWGVYALDVRTSEYTPINNTPKFAETYPALSPDGRWLVYVSNESGRDEIYVTPFPGGGRKWQVSTAGGGHPRWNRNGREIYYVTPATDTLTAVEVDGSTGTFRIGSSTELFPTLSPEMGIKYSPSRDGERFLVFDPVEAASPAPLTLVVNWTAELAR